MESTSKTRHGERAERWPALPYEAWRDTCQTLHLWTQIVVYCSDENCIASTALGQLLERHGYTHVLHFAGGLQEREQAGYLLEGEWVKKQEG